MANGWHDASDLDLMGFYRDNNVPSSVLPHPDCLQPLIPHSWIRIGSSALLVPYLSWTKDRWLLLNIKIALWIWAEDLQRNARIMTRLNNLFT